MIVGEAGVSPDYFLSKMSPDEAADFLEGFRRREREAWERARIGWCLQVSDAQNKSATELFPFTWDSKPPTKRITKKQRNMLRQKADAIAKILTQHEQK